MRAGRRLAWCVLAAATLSGRAAVGQTLDRRQVERLEAGLRREGQAILALADAAAAGRQVPSDFHLGWHNDYLKAVTGTFVPFVVTIADAPAPAILLYVRVTPRAADAAPGRRQHRPAAAPRFSFEDVYPLELPPDRAQPFRLTRGFAVPAGEYDIVVVAREREAGGTGGGRRTAAVLRRSLSVPDFTTPELTTSTIMLADRLVPIGDAEDAGELALRPYVLGERELRPALDRTFRPNQELLVVFLIYNPAITPDEQFHLQVEYHFFRKMEPGSAGPDVPGDPRAPAARPGEQYMNRTEPQRFTPQVLGPRYTPAAGQPILAGQGVPLAGFESGHYRLAITVSDLVSGRKIERDVTFRVGA